MRSGKEIYTELISRPEVRETVVMTQQEIFNMFDVSIMIDLPCDNVMNLSAIQMYLYRLADTIYGNTYRMSDISRMMPYWCETVADGLNKLLRSMRINHRSFTLNYTDGFAEVIYG